jgi:Zn-finger nucleic acid-binding protein
MNNPVQIKNGLLGRRSISYGCPRCKTRLTSPLDDAGKSDTCPECGAVFAVPGVAERDRIHAENAAAAQQRSEQQQARKVENERRAAEEAAHRKALREYERVVSTPGPASAPIRRTGSLCTNCGYLGKSTTVVQGSFLIEVILWLFFLIPGIIYSIWRLTTKHRACPKCGARNMIPPDSPRAQKLLRELNSDIQAS